MRSIAIPAALVALVASPAAAFTAINGLQVNPVQGGFEVVSYGGDGPRQIWCAAADYARHVQGARNTQRIYILDGYGPSKTRQGKRAVAFTLNGADGPRLGTNGNYSVSLRQPGFNISTGHAEQFCADVFEKLDDVWPF